MSVHTMPTVTTISRPFQAASWQVVVLEPEDGYDNRTKDAIVSWQLSARDVSKDFPAFLPAPGCLRHVSVVVLF